MTKAERAAEKVRKEKEKQAELDRQYKEDREKQQVELRKAEASLREETRQADNKRCFHVGALVKEKGLFQHTNEDLATVFTLLATLQGVPSLAEELERLLNKGLEAVKRG